MSKKQRTDHESPRGQLSKRVHLFALEQAYDAYEFFHQQIIKCEKAIETALQSLQVKDNPPSKTPPVLHLKDTRRKHLVIGPLIFLTPQISIKKITVTDLTQIPGIDGNTAMKILSEIGTDMSKWPNAKAFTSWLGLCPGNKISGGKILSSKTKPSNNRAAQALRMAAATLYRSKTAIGAFFRRMRARLGAPKAITATAHKLARIIYRMLSDHIDYLEAGENEYEKRYQKRVLKNLKQRAEELGYELTPAKIIS